MKKRIVYGVLLLFCILFGLTGCSDSESTYKEENAESVPTEVYLAESEEEDIQTLSFIHVEKEVLLDEEGRQFRIKGMCFGNNVWANLSEPTLTHHDKDSYEELEELGFNTVRFYMNYRLFEEDENPYVYKESGFEWLDKNIEWAREHNIRLILNMHVPQGGFLSASNVQFWKEEENIKRYMALWCEIAKRYSDEPVILGYGVMNEPFVPKMATEEESLNLYYELIEELMSEVRKIDDKHIFFVERPYGIVDEHNTVNYAWGDVGSFRVLSDKNVVYEFHFYENTSFTSQGISWANFERDWYYEDDSIALLSGNRLYFAVCKEKSITDYDAAQGGWQYLESPIYDLADYPEANAAYFLLYYSELAKDTTVLMDDIVVKEYDAQNNWIRDIYQYSFDSSTACSGWDLSEGTGGKCAYTDVDGHNAAGCEMITDAGGNYQLYKNDSLYNYFPITKGNKYQVGLWIKVKGKEDIKVEPGMQLVSVDNVYALNRDFLENKLLTYVNIGKEKQVPVYIGEYGTTSHIMGNEFGGEKWVSDVMDIFNEYSLNYSYHDYHEENYGFYTTPATQERNALNEDLYQVFADKVKN